MGPATEARPPVTPVDVTQPATGAMAWDATEMAAVADAAWAVVAEFVRTRKKAAAHRPASTFLVTHVPRPNPLRY